MFKRFFVLDTRKVAGGLNSYLRLKIVFADCENFANRIEGIEKGTHEFLHFISTNSTGCRSSLC